MDRSDPTHNHQHRGGGGNNARSSATSASAARSSALLRGSHNRPWLTEPGAQQATGSSRIGGIDVGDLDDDLQQAPRFNRGRSNNNNNYSPSPSPRGGNNNDSFNYNDNSINSLNATSPRSNNNNNNSIGGFSSYRTATTTTTSGGNSYETPIAIITATDTEIRTSSPSSSSRGEKMSKSNSSPRLMTSSYLPSVPPVYNNDRVNSSSKSSVVPPVPPPPPIVPPTTFKTSMSTSSYERYRARLRQQEDEQQQQQQAAPTSSSAAAALSSSSAAVAATAASKSSGSSRSHQDHNLQKSNSVKNLVASLQQRTAASNEMLAAMATMKKAQAQAQQQQQAQQAAAASTVAVTPTISPPVISTSSKSKSSKSSSKTSSSLSSSSKSKQTTGSSRDMRKSRLLAAEQERNSQKSSSSSSNNNHATEISSAAASESSSSKDKKNKDEKKKKSKSHKNNDHDQSSSLSSTVIANSSSLSSSRKTAPLPPPPPPSIPSSSTAKLSTTSSSSSRSSTTIQQQPQQPLDEMARTTDAAVRGWSTAQSRNRRREAETTIRNSNNSTSSTDNNSNNTDSVAEAEAAAVAAQAAAAQAAAMEAAMMIKTTNNTVSKNTTVAASAATLTGSGNDNIINNNAAAPPPVAPLPVDVNRASSSIGGGGLGSSKVGAYLAARQRRNSSLRPVDTARATAATRGGASNVPVVTASALTTSRGDKQEARTTTGGAPTATTTSGTASASSSARASYSSMASSSFDENGTSASGGPLTMTDEDEDEDGNSISSCSSGSEIENSNEPEWSVRVCVVSAVDFPPNVVPNVPFSPVLKVGVVHLPKMGVVGDPSTAAAGKSTSATSTRVDSSLDAATRGLQTAIETSGLMAFPKARIRCTSSKVLSKRDNGSVEFHEEMRWDRVQNAHEAALVIELSARAVMTPTNIRESPVAQNVQSLLLPSSDNSTGRKSPMNRGDRGGDPAVPGKLGSLFRRGGRQKSASEMETANAAAVVAKHLVEGEEGKSLDDFNDEEGTGPLFDSKLTNPAKILAAGHQSEMDVKLRSKRRQKRPKMTEDIRLGSQIVPFTKLPLSKALKGKESARIEQWFELNTDVGAGTGGPPPPLSGAAPRSAKRNPSILLEISFSAPEILDESEDDMDEVDELPPGAELKASFSRRASIKIRNQLKQEVTPEEPKAKEEEPVLAPGVIDYVCVVGARDIGDQKADDGSSGWVKTKPECCLLEQFPPSADLHASNGRNTPLPDKIEWFCFPEGCRLWRGTTPPNADELNLKRFSASSPANIATTIASFDAWLGCTTSFSWFVLASNSDEYGSAQNKTVGACIRFYVPAPVGIDPTQDDFAQTLMGVGPTELDGVAKKRLWVPIGICLVSSIPIVGAMEVMLLRLCEALATQGFSPKDSGRRLSDRLYEELRCLIINYQRPIPGVVHCSIPFLEGDRLLIGLPPRTGLPPLPHGSSVTSVCRLLGADGVTFILSAMLTECKILLHSDDVANLCLVAEVMTALLYPFSWSLPYIPVLPLEMMEFVEAPLSYLLGVPSCNMLNVGSHALDDVVVVDLDRDFSSGEFFEERSSEQRFKAPTPLPSSTANNISKAVYRLLHSEDELDDGSGSFSSQRIFPRLEAETLQEREFRIAVALELCGLVRGYQDCLAYASSSQPILNVDKFLQSAPVLFDDQRGPAAAVTLQGVSPRSRRFMSIFVNCQHFHQFIESIDTEAVSFFHEIMAELNAFGAKKDLLAVKRVLSLDAQKTIDQLSSSLQRMDDKIPVYHVKAIESATDGGKDCTAQFPFDLLQSIVLSTDSQRDVGSSSEAEGVKHLSVEYLVELEKNPWRYQAVFTVDLEGEGNGSLPVAEKVKLREAIGERRYRAWKSSIERGDGDDGSVLSEDISKGNVALDLSTLLSYNADDATAASSESGSLEESPEQSSQRRIQDAKDRDVLRRCLERARVSGRSTAEPLMESGRDLVSEAETALRNPSARRFLLSALSKRSHSENEGKDPKGRRRTTLSGISKLDEGAFEVLVRLGCAMLDACMEDKDYDSTYSLLKLTAGLYCTVGEGDAASILYMTQRMGHHPIYADLGVWEKAKEMHLSARQEDNGKGDSGEIDEEYDEYEAAVATLYEMLGYGIPAEELARFASRVSEENGWFRSERGQSLLLLARRICIRRDQGEAQSSSKTSDIEMMSPATKGRKEDKTDQSNVNPPPSSTPPPFEDVTVSWVEIGWAHPAAQSSRRGSTVERVRRTTSPSTQSSIADDQDSGQRHSNYMKRSAITSMAYLGSSVVVTGGLDGGVFMARKVPSQEQEKEDAYLDPSGVRGVHLDWGSSGSRYAVGSASTSMDGEYGVGAVSCLAATRAANQSYHALMSPRDTEKDVVGALDDEELLDAMEGCRVVAGTTCGDLRVWSVKDVLSAVFFANRGGDLSASAQNEARTFHRGGEGASSATISGRRKATTDFAAGSSLTRLKFSLRGRALSGHRGGVSCVDVPSNVYRPDSVISGGADGLIKLWSLRAPGSGRRSEIDQGSLMTTKGAVDQLSPRTKAARSGDALSILSGHGGRILCVKTAWHGDRLLSGGADRTVRVWDLAGSGGKCLHSLSGHFGWVSSVQYWGPNTIISASTDRSIALWDARVRNSPLFTLRHHYAPISDVLVGSRTDPIMISAASDGTIAAWDFRRLSDENSQSERSKQRMCKVVRRPAATLYLHDFSSRRHVCGPTLLSRGPSLHSKTVFCVGRDAVIREWDICTGEVVSEHATGHCDTISSFASFQGDQLYDTQLESTGSESVSGTITTSWDGTVRIRRLAR